MKVIVCGGRDYSNREFLFEKLQEIHSINPITCLIHGGARGVDSLAKEWALLNNIETKEYLADWNKHGKAAGFIRNKEMLKENPIAVIAFPGGNGTQNMIDISRKANIFVMEIRE